MMTEEEVVGNLRQDAKKFRRLSAKYPGIGRIGAAAERLERLVEKLEKGDNDDT
jgi:hypothetical protein